MGGGKGGKHKKHAVVWRILKGFIQVLTMCYPSMPALVTLSLIYFPRFETLTTTVHKSASDSLEINRKDVIGRMKGYMSTI